jgi:hypothetical protein
MKINQRIIIILITLLIHKELKDLGELMSWLREEKGTN